MKKKKRNGMTLLYNYFITLLYKIKTVLNEHKAEFFVMNTKMIIQNNIENIIKYCNIILFALVILVFNQLKEKTFHTYK